MQDVSFSDLNLPEWLSARIAEVGYDAPTPVQAAAIPLVRSGVDVVAQAQTGTGKTAAFVIPLLAAIDPKAGPVQVVILAPTRELARQVCDEFDTLGHESGIDAFAVYGGVGMEPQIEAFQRAHVLVCTPGRLLDHLRRGTLSFNNLRTFGLDEADEMLSMGFEREITEILRLLPEKRQNILFSATMPHEVMRFADNFLVDAERLNLSSDSVGAASVHHVFYNIEGGQRIAALRALLRSHTVRGAIIFANTKSETFRVAQLLESEGYSTGVLNGDLPQKDRERIIERLKDEALDFLVATDIAARGIDISWLRAVINYELPDTAETYIHRTGRTGRAGTVGTAYSFATPGDVGVIHQLKKFYSIRMEDGTLPDRVQVRNTRADEEISRLLEPLDSDQRLAYGRYLAVARRLADRQDGDRDIAKLLAYFESVRAGATDTPTEDAANAVVAPAPAQQAALQQAPVVAEAPERSDAREQAPAVQAPTGPVAPEALTAGAIRAWILENSRPTNPVRSTHAIARALGVEESLVDSLAETDPHLERLAGRNARWRVRIDDSATASVAHTTPADVDRPQRQERVHRELDEPAAPAHAEAASIERRDDPRRQRRDDDRKPRPTQPASSLAHLVRREPRAWVQLRINVGADRFTNDRDLGRWFAEYAGFENDDIRHVDLRDKSAVIEVDESYWRDFVEALHNQAWDGHQLHVHRAR